MVGLDSGYQRVELWLGFKYRLIMVIVLFVDVLFSSCFMDRYGRYQRLKGEGFYFRAGGVGASDRVG